jgi:sugar lactone lactonase YvrE
VSAVITAIRPGWAVPGGRVTIEGVGLPQGVDGPPSVTVADRDAHVVAASAGRVRIVVPPEAAGGPTAVRFEALQGETAFVEVARPLATGLHLVDSPVYDSRGRLVVTQSGTRGTRVPVPLYRVGDDGVREPVAVEIANPTSLALGPDGALYVSSRFEGHVHRLLADDTAEIYASELGVPTGLAFAPDGTLFVGDRSGTIFRVSPSREVESFATLPSSVAAFHLAFGPDGCLYVAAPTLSTHDPIYRISPTRLVDVIADAFGRPQGLAFDAAGTLFVVDALAGDAGLYRLDVSQPAPVPELVVAAPALVGIALRPSGGVVLASNDTVWTLDLPTAGPAR